MVQKIIYTRTYAFKEILISDHCIYAKIRKVKKFKLLYPPKNAFPLFLCCFLSIRSSCIPTSSVLAECLNRYKIQFLGSVLCWEKRGNLIIYWNGTQLASKRGRCQWPLRGAQLALRCAVLIPQTSKTMTAVIRAKEQSPASSDLQSHPTAFTREMSYPTLQLKRGSD